MTTQSTAAGWYADAADPRLIRWWDGAAWTDHTQPNPSAPSAPVSSAPIPSAAVSSSPASSAPASSAPASSAPQAPVPSAPSMPTAAGAWVPPPFADPAGAVPASTGDPGASAARADGASVLPLAEPTPGPRRVGSSLPISEPVRLVPPTSGSVPMTIPGFDAPLTASPLGAAPLGAAPLSAAPTGAPLGGLAPLAVPSSVGPGGPQPASATTPWTSTGTFAQPRADTDLASVDYEPMTRTWGSGRGSATQRSVTGVTTAGAWMLALSPVLQLGLVALGWAVTEGGTSAVTSVVAGALGVVAVLWIVLAAILDFRRLGALGHEFRPSVAWIVLGPFFYLMARAIHLYRTSRRGTAPTWVFLALAVVVGAVGSLGALALPRDASASELRGVEQQLTQQLQAQGIEYSVLCPSQASASLGASFVCTAYDEVGPAALIRVTWTGVGEFSYAFESTVALTG